MINHFNLKRICKHVSLKNLDVNNHSLLWQCQTCLMVSKIHEHWPEAAIHYFEINKYNFLKTGKSDLSNHHFFAIEGWEDGLHIIFCCTPFFFSTLNMYRTFPCVLSILSTCLNNRHLSICIHYAFIGVAFF